MLKKRVLAGSVLALMLSTGLVAANDRYGQRQPVLMSNEVSQPWLLQLRRGGPVNGISQSGGGNFRAIIAPAPRKIIKQRKIRTAAPVVRQRKIDRRGHVIQTAAPRTVVKKPQRRPLPEQFLPQNVSWSGKEKPGSIVIDTSARHLYLITGNGEARRYGVGVGKAGFEWRGTEKITRKREWPDWRPPAEMRAREAKKGRHLPVHMAGGPSNPLGARALYLGSTLYRIHGTNAPWTIGQAVSSGCIRMRNEDVVDLYERVRVGATVVVR